MSASADRNLLFGTLAVQLDFISKDALVAAMNAWLLDKSRPLGEILREQGRLSADRLHLLTALVAEHLKQHGDDPHMSLAALSGVVADVQLRLPRVPGESPTDSDSPITASDPSATAAQPLPSPPTAGRYRILRPHAKGGLGEVFVAEDLELGRHVALKEIQVQHVHRAEFRQRFVREAQITGGLEHPGIVPVYGLGMYADGRPYYAMRFVKGTNLRHALRRFHPDGPPPAAGGRRFESLAFRELLGRFVDVCQAVAYAHSRGVLHRDLKPGNIMLGKYGETLVVDWGLAKPVGRAAGGGDLSDPEDTLRPPPGGESSDTAAGQAIGTPAYMAPEQAGGRVNDLGPAADIYSLGATLYEMLTGRVPFPDGDLGAVQRGEFAPPRRVAADVPEPLEAVCLKAMALRPADRYPSAQALADDIEHWLADEPVAACREPIGARARRAVRKHPGPMVGLAATVLVGLIGAAAGLYFVNAEKDRTEQARLDEEAARRDAETARDQARRRFELALDAFNQMVFGLQNRLEPRPAMLTLRKELLQTARAGLEKLLQESEKQGTPDRTLIWAYLRLGDVEMVLGNTQAARSQYEAGYQLARKLAAADPRDAAAQRDLSVSLSRVGNLRLRLGDAEAALLVYEQGLAIDRTLAADAPHNLDARRDLAVSFAKVGDAQLRLGRREAALQSYRDALAIHQKLADADPDNAQARRDVSVSLVKVGDVQTELGDAISGLQSYRDALAIHQKLAEADPQNSQARRDVGVSFGRIGDAQLRLGDSRAALGSFGEALSIDRRLVVADPENAQFQRSLNVTLNKVGDAQARFGGARAALQSYQDALAIAQKLAAADPRNPQAQRDLAISFARLASIHRQLAEFHQAALWYDRVLAQAKQWPAPNTLDLDVKFAEDGREFCRLAEKAVAEEDLAFRQPPELISELLGARVRALIKGGNPAAAAATAARFAEWAARQTDDPGSKCYDAACALALSAHASNDGGAESRAARAVDLLRRAFANGFTDVGHMIRDPELDSLRSRPDYVVLLWDLADAPSTARSHDHR